MSKRAVVTIRLLGTDEVPPIVQVFRVPTLMLQEGKTNASASPSHACRNRSCGGKNAPGCDSAEPESPFLRHQSRFVYGGDRPSFRSAWESLLAGIIRRWLHRPLAVAV